MQALGVSHSFSDVDGRRVLELPGGLGQQLGRAPAIVVRRDRVRPAAGRRSQRLDVPEPLALLPQLARLQFRRRNVLDLVEPALAPGALVVADLSQDDPEQIPYCERMHDPQGGYVTVEVPLDAGVVVSVRTP